jgi:hypothetical protein
MVEVCLFTEGESMSKSKNHNAKSQAETLPKNSGGRRMLILTAILTAMLITGGVLAQWTSVFSVPQTNSSKAGQLSPASFNANVPARELVYAGGKLVATDEPQSTPCTSVITPSYQSFPGITGNGSVAVAVESGCNWTAVSNNNWITVTAGGSGTGTGAVQFSLLPNGTGAIRSGTLTIAGKTFTIYQGFDFTDVLQSSFYYSFIGKLVARGVTAGCTGTTYCPSQALTRQEMAALVIRGLGEFNPPTPGSQRFNDVAPSSQFYNYIDRMAVLNITAGCSTSPPNYCPLNTITHEQMAVFIIKALGMLHPPAPTTQRFADVPLLNNPYAPYIEQMAERGIWTGTGCPGTGNYCPSSSVTREQMAAILVRAFNL